MNTYSNFPRANSSAARDSQKKILEYLLKHRHNTSRLTGLGNRKTNDLYTRLHEDCQIYLNQVIIEQKNSQLNRHGKKARSRGLILTSQRKALEDFTRKPLLTHLKDLYNIYMGTGEVAEAFRVLRAIGDNFPENLNVMFLVFRFFLEVGHLRRAESFLLQVVSSLKQSPHMLTVYSILLFQMKKYKEALINYRVGNTKKL